MTITRKQKIIAAVLAATIAVYAIFGFYLLPMIVRGKLPALLAEKTRQQAQLKAVRFNPFSFQFELDGFSLSAPDGKSLFGFDALSVNLNAFASLTRQAFVFDSIVLHKPLANIKRQSDGSLNFSGMLPKDAEAPPADKKKRGVLPLTVLRLAIEEGQISWLDASAGEPQSEILLPVNFSIADLSTQSAVGAAFDLVLGLASGGHMQWRGELGLTPVASKGRISLDEIVLPKVWQLFLREILPVEITGGRFTLQTEYQASVADSGLALSVSNGSIDIKQLEIAEKGQKTGLLAIPVIAMRGIAVDLNKQQVSVASLSSNDAQIKAWLQQDGRVNYQALFAKPDAAATAASSPPPPVPSAASQPWQISLGELALNNYQLLFTDQSRKSPQTMQLSGINFNLRDFGNRGGEKLPVQLSATFNDLGKLKIDGDISSLSPFTAALAVDIKTIKLKTFQSYLDDYLNLQLIDGDFNSQGNLQLKAADDLQLGFQGDANVYGLITRDKLSNKDFVKWSDLQLQKIGIDLAKQSVTLEKVVFDRPYARFTIKKDRSTNIGDVIVQQPASQSIADQPANSKTDKPQTGPVVSIGKIELKDGNSDFADYSLILPFVAEMNGLNGEADGFSSDQDNALKLALQGRVYDMAQVGIKGTYQIKSGNSAISLKFSHLPLPLITPYMADFAGYKIEKGQMALDLQYKIQKGQLEAQNKVFIDQLTLGEQVENPHATSLPLHLAIALLKDTDGRINLDFPVTGSLEDPQFSVGSLIADVLVNLVVKVVASPFKALGALLDEEHDYSTVNFAAGGAEMNAEETAKLDKLAKALESKPDLTLEIKGMAYQAQDWPVMRFDAVKDILKKMKSGELRDKGETIRSEYIELSDDEYKRLLAKFFKEVFPQEIDHSLLGAPRMKSQPDADFYVVARQKLESIMQPEPQRLNDLAVARANSISKYLIEKDHLDIDRIYILAPELGRDDAAAITSVLSLNVAH